MDDLISTETFLEEIRKRHVKVELGRGMDMGQFNHESGSQYYSECEENDELLIKDNAEFQELREKYISQIEEISKMLRQQRDQKKMKKE